MVVTLYILWLVLNVVGLSLIVRGLLKWYEWLTARGTPGPTFQAPGPMTQDEVDLRAQLAPARSVTTSVS
jgi:hypothetical protein